MPDRGHRRYGVMPGGRGVYARWITAALLAAALVALRLSPWPQLRPARAAVARLAAERTAPAALASLTDRVAPLWREARSVWRWPPVSGGTHVDAVSPPAPVWAMPVAGVVIAPFGPGTDPLTAQPAVMPGVLLRTAARAAVRAPVAGRVADVSASPPVGERVAIALPNGTETAVAGISHVSVKPGDMVRAGRLLGDVAAAGPGSVPHVLVTVTRHGRAVDPLSRSFFGPAG